MFGHPKGLFYLFFTELWERFSYYGMRAILVFFLTSTTKGGLAWDVGDALTLYAIYTALVYVMSIPGGIIADRYLGQKKSVMLGGFLLILGHLLMAYTATWSFFTALVLIILGVGFLKPNISTMVGGLYKPGDGRRDAGFTIFYIGINVGALLASLIVGYVGENIGWHYGFALAGIGMILGQIVFISGQKHLKTVGNLITDKQQSAIVHQKEPFTRREKNRIKVLLISFLIVWVFWACFEQAGGFMSLFTKQYTDRFITKEVVIDEYTTKGLNQIDANAIETVRLVVKEKSKLDIKSFKDLYRNLFFRNPKSVDEIMDSIGKKNIGNYIDAKTYTVPKLELDSTTYNNLTSEETIVYRDGDKYIISDLNNDQQGFMIPASWFQSLNPFFIIIFGSVFAALWLFLARRNKEPNTMFKFGISTIILGLGFLLMVFASMEKDSSIIGKSSLWWLVGAYLFHTLGELCISPIALSFITKVAPKRIVSSMMGLYFAVTGLGNFAAGFIGKQAENFGDMAVFSGITIFSMLFGLVLLMFASRLMRLTHGAEKAEEEI